MIASIENRRMSFSHEAGVGRSIVLKSMAILASLTFYGVAFASDRAAIAATRPVPAALTLVSYNHGSVPAPSSNFSFVIIGDTRPHFASEDFSPFEKLIPRINAAKPSFVINLGDLIYGYRFHRAAPQWDKYEAVIRNIKAPYYQIPGNHDTYSAAARDLYGRRFGRFYESFDYRGWHFVLLDNGEESRWGYLGPAEFTWLKNDLNTHRGQPIFVFMHFPVWIPGRFASDTYDFWRAELQPLFKAGGVRAVFGGHFHTYGPTHDIDGIKYFITGGGGAELRPFYVKAGGVHHFLKMNITGNTFDLRVVTERGELTDAEADFMGGLLFAEKNISWIGIGGNGPQQSPAGLRCSVMLNNPYAEPLVGRAEWAYDKNAFVIEPKEIAVRVAPKAKQTYIFDVKTAKAGAPLSAMPRLEFDVASGARRHIFHREILFLEKIAAPFRAKAPILDGRLDDWAGVPVLKLAGERGAEAELRACHDSQRLYLLASVPEPQISTGPEGGIPAFQDAFQIGFSGRLGASEFAVDELRLGFSRAGARVVIKDRTPGGRSGTAGAGSIADVAAVCRSIGGRIICEIAIPAKMLKLFESDGGRKLVLNASFWEPESEEVSGEGLIPVHFIELVLGRRR
jgi:hypothetical protein